MVIKDEIADILEIQQKIYKDAINMLFSSVNQRVDDQCKMIQELKSSLEYSQSEISCLKQELAVAKKQIEDSNNTISDQSKFIKTLNTKIDKLDNYSRRKNIRIDGLTEVSNENQQQTQQKVDKLLKNNLQLQNIKIEIAHRLPRSTLIPGGQPRTIIAKLTSTVDKEETMRNKYKLKGTGIFVNEDLSEGVMKIRHEKLPELQSARNAGKIAYFRRDKLIIKDKKYDDHLREQTPVPTSSRTPSPSNVSTLIQTFTPSLQLENAASPAARPREHENSKNSMEQNQNDDNDKKDDRTRLQKKNNKKK